MKRKLFVASTIAAALTGCAKVTNSLADWQALNPVLDSVNTLDHAIIGTRGMAKLYKPSDVTVDYPVNSLDTPHQPEYLAFLEDNYASYRLPITGLVDHPQTFTLRQLRALATLDEITRHDCVEGWSVVGAWRGVALGSLLKLVRPKPQARYVIMYSYDHDGDGTQFYGSLDLTQAAHPQTMLALDLNGKPIDAAHGAPVRLRIPTQLGYKSTKWIRNIELAADYSHIFGGSGGYWEDQGYAWYAGI